MKQIKINNNWYLSADKYCYYVYEYRLNENEKSKNHDKMVLYANTYHATLKQAFNHISEEELKRGLTIELGDWGKYVDKLQELKDSFVRFIEAYNLRFEPK